MLKLTLLLFVISTFARDQNKCVRFFRDLFDTENGLAMGAKLQSISTVQNLFLSFYMMSHGVMDMGVYQPSPGNADACMDLGSDYHYCTIMKMGGQMSGGSICLPSVCEGDMPLEPPTPPFRRNVTEESGYDVEMFTEELTRLVNRLERRNKCFKPKPENGTTPKPTTTLEPNTTTSKPTTTTPKPTTTPEPTTTKASTTTSKPPTTTSTTTTAPPTTTEVGTTTEARRFLIEQNELKKDVDAVRQRIKHFQNSNVPEANFALHELERHLAKIESLATTLPPVGNTTLPPAGNTTRDPYNPFTAECIAYERTKDYIISVGQLLITLSLVRKTDYQQQDMYKMLKSLGLTMTCVTKEAADANLHDRDAGTNATIALFAILAFIVLGSTLFIWKRDTQEKVLEKDVESFTLLKNEPREFEKPLWEKILEMFALQNTLYGLFYPGKKVAFPCLDGLRAFSMLWVLLGHTAAFWMGKFGNVGHAYHLMVTWTGQAFNQAFLSVDSFFFISGFLATYLCIKKLSGKDGRRPRLCATLTKLPFVYLLRWLRLAVPMVFVMLWHLNISTMMMEVTPDAKNVMGFKHQCTGKNWWLNVFFLINDTEEGIDNLCVGMAWYLQTDMRIFLYIPLIAVFYIYIHPWFAFTFTFLAWVGNLIARFVHVWDNNISMFADGPDIVNFWVDGMYFEIWSRYGVMCVGAMLAILWHMKWKKIEAWTSSQQAVIFFFCAFFMYTSVYGMYGASKRAAENPCANGESSPDCGSGWGKFTNAMWIATNRSVWGLGLACLCMLCFKDQFPFVNAFLSHDFLKPIARLSFMMYLIQMDAFVAYLGNETNNVRYSVFWLSYAFISMIVADIAWALLLYCLVEVPFLKLVKMGVLNLQKMLSGEPPQPASSAIPAKSDRSSGVQVFGEDQEFKKARYSGNMGTQTGSGTR